jgi:arginyl-tRNA synthetase
VFDTLEADPTATFVAISASAFGLPPNDAIIAVSISYRGSDRRCPNRPMNLLSELRNRFRPALAGLSDDVPPLLDMIRPTQDPRFGDYQANCAMPLGKQWGRPPREIAEQIAEQIQLDDLCDPPEVAGPGFINLRLKDDRLAGELKRAVGDARLGVALVETPRTYVIDYSSPNVAKPMHVGHIRSTVIGDALCRTLRFLGHKVISDNHLGDWGTQFGMIIYGYRHFADSEAYRARPVEELARVYQLVRRLVDYHEGKLKLPAIEERLARQQQAVDQAEAKLGEAAGDKAVQKKAQKEVRRLQTQLSELRSDVDSLRDRLATVEGDADLAALASAHAEIVAAVLEETAKLHADDPDNLALWHDFLPKCRNEINRVYERLDIRFDEELGESFYHDRLAAVVEEFQSRDIARESDGATCVFLEGYDTPMIIRKKDGAFLYATTDLATIQYRLQRWTPGAILYVVDHRQGEHFGKLFAAARKWLDTDVELTHVSFGTVLGADGRPFRTRAGDTVGLEGLLDEAVRRALAVVSENDDAKPGGPELSGDQRQRIAEVVGIAALKYADLAQNRTSDYVFSYDKMLALNGNTATYMQYAHARVRSIFAKGGVDLERLRESPEKISITEAPERALGLALLQLGEALELTVADYRPNLLTSYLFELAEKFSTFYQNCPVLAAESDASRTSRLLLCDLTARTLKQGLELLGIEVVEKM